MRQAHRLLFSLVAQISLASTLCAGEADGAASLVQSRALLEKGEFEKAAALAEKAIANTTPENRAAAQALLRKAYRSIISKAEAAGNTRVAQEYRDNLLILEIPSSGAPEMPAPPKQPTPPAAMSEPKALETLPALEAAPESNAAPDAELRPAPPAPAGKAPVSAPPGDPALQKADLLSPLQEDPAEILKEPAQLPDPGPLPPPTDPLPPNPDAPRPPAQAPAGSRTRPPARGTSAAPAAAATAPARAPASPAGNTLGQADQLFTAKRYGDAGLIYSQLAAGNRLPEERKPVWAYCRWVAVVARINAHPATDQEWTDIEQEILSVQRLVPGNWYGEYLRNRVAEARKAAGRSGRLVVRGSAPEESAARKRPRFLARAQAAPGPAQPIPQPVPPAPSGEQKLTLPAQVESHERDPAPTPDVPGPAPVAPAASPVSWQVYESANFRVFHVDSATALQASQAAEAVRSSQAKRWGSAGTRGTWAPKCDIYLYPTARDLAQMTGQPETSPGFSTMGVSGNRIISRRVNLRADHPQLLTAILPHEVTHVVLADLFPDKQIPRWADEGMAVLAEPVQEQLARAGDLAAPLDNGRLFKLSELMAIDSPNAESWSLYYAQSVSLTQFLVQAGTPQQFVAFVRMAQREGIEQALRDHYQIDGFTDLESRWRSHARRQITSIASAKDPARNAAEATRQE